MNTYLNDPKELVTLFNSVREPDNGTNYLQEAVLDAKSKQIQINITRVGYTPFAPLSQD